MEYIIKHCEESGIKGLSFHPTRGTCMLQRNADGDVEICKWTLEGDQPDLDALRAKYTDIDADAVRWRHNNIARWKESSESTQKRIVRGLVRELLKLKSPLKKPSVRRVETVIQQILTSGREEDMAADADDLGSESDESEDPDAGEAEPAAAQRPVVAGEK